MANVITCPECKGKKILRALAHMKPIEFPCRHCKATGEVPKEMLVWIARGKELRAERLARNVTLRAEARNTGVNVVALSDRERGVVDNR